MRENRTHGSEGGESGETGLPYPYPADTASPLSQTLGDGPPKVVAAGHGGIVEGVEEIASGGKGLWDVAVSSTKKNQSESVCAF